MNRLLFTLPAAILVSLAAVAPAPVVGAGGSPNFVCDNTADTPLTGDHSRTHVVVEEGASCYIEGAVVHSVRADHPENVFILGSNPAHRVSHNVMIRGATGDVVIGSEVCGFDPAIGNNIMVRDSNNVLICDMAVDNNISVTGSHGRVTIRDSIACNNLTASRNAAYDGPDGTEAGHGLPDAIRLIDVRAGIHIKAERNSTRPVILRRADDRFMRPSACRRMLKAG